MPKRRRSSRSSRGRSNAVGLLVALVVAVVLGIGVGSYVGNLLRKPGTMPAAPSSSTSSLSSPTPRAAHSRSMSIDGSRGSARARVEERPAPETEQQNATAGKTTPEQTASGATTRDGEPKPAPQAPKRRPAGMAGEFAHAVSSSKIALTFDAGASPAPTPSILKTLADKNLHVTFFLTGRWAEQNEALVREIRSQGHEIGNHTYSHPDLRQQSDAKIEDQLQKTDDIVARITGKPCDPLFRPPFGGRDKRVLGEVDKLGYTSVYWSLDSWDAFKKGITSKEITDRILSRIQGGDVVLMHCGSQATADALPGLIRELENRGYQIVKVSGLMASR